jgi:hypothetical protein
MAIFGKRNAPAATNERGFARVTEQQDAQAMADKLARELDTFVANVNRTLPRKVVPWAMLPYACWQGPNADLLLKLGMFPMGQHNTLLLAEDEAGAMVLDIPKHPRVIDGSLITSANKVLGELRESYTAQHLAAGEQAGSGDWSGMNGFSAVRDKTREIAINIGLYLASQQFGKDGVLKSRQMFFGG